MTRARGTSSPPWLRALLAIDRAFERGHALEAMVRDELAWSLVSERDRAAVTSAIYTASGSYTEPSGHWFKAPLFPWEAKLLARDDFPTQGHVLVGGAGSGRELRALCARGFEVTAFEPCAPLADVAVTRAEGFGDRARVLRGAYEDLTAARRGAGPLAALYATPRPEYALVVLGWRSLSHVLDEHARIDAIVALDALAPRAPIVFSFVPETRIVGPSRLRDGLRGALRRLGAPATPPRGALFVPSAGFAVALDRGDVERLASTVKRRLDVYETAPEGVALLMPS